MMENELAMIITSLLVQGSFFQSINFRARAMWADRKKEKVHACVHAFVLVYPWAIIPPELVDL